MTTTKASIIPTTVPALLKIDAITSLWLFLIL
jgi:hypothetical protein